MLSETNPDAFPPCPAPFNMAEYVLSGGQSCPDKTALEVLTANAQETWTFQQLTNAIRGTATGFQRLGLRPGDVVLIRLGNRVDVPIAYLAAIAMGAVPVPSSPQWTETETQAVIDELSPSLILSEQTVPCPPHANQLDVSKLEPMRGLPPCAFVQGDPNRLAYIVYTSGTSGRPRAVEHAHRAIWARRMMHADWYDLRSDDRMLHAGAFNWTFTMGTGLMDPWSVGATAIIPADGTPPSALSDLIRRSQPTLFAAAPGVFRKMLQGELGPMPPRFRHGLCAGEKLSTALADAWHAQTKTALFEAYGMSECSTFVSACSHAPATDGSLGRPQRGRRVAIIGDDGEPVERGKVGTIAIHRSDPGLMRGYRGAVAETKARFAGDWFLTGDLGEMRADGQLAFAGRRDDMMNAGGYRVSPLEVEAALSQIPDVQSIAVTDIEVKADARVIMAFYTSEMPIDPQVFHDFATRHLAPYKRPRSYTHVMDLPVGPNGKLSRRKLTKLWSAK